MAGWDVGGTCDRVAISEGGGSTDGGSEPDVNGGGGMCGGFELMSCGWATLMDSFGGLEDSGCGSLMLGEVCASRCEIGIIDREGDGRWTSDVDKERQKRGSWRKSMVGASRTVEAAYLSTLPFPALYLIQN